MIFANPEILLLLLLLPLIALLDWRRMVSRQGGMRFSSTSAMKEMPRSIWTRARSAPMFLRMIALALGITALARPQVENVTREVVAEGIDIMLVMDLSGSMQAEDLLPNRFEATRRVAHEFVDSRVSDRIGLTVFSGRAFTMVPPTLDYDFLKRMLDEMELGMVEDGTAIGMGLAAAVNRMKDSEAVGRVAILLTDGENNRGEIDPLTAADIAAAMGVRVYTIGASSEGETAPFPVSHPYFGRRMAEIPIDIDEDMMRAVAERTGGRYFRATDTEALRSIYREIGELETTRLEDLLYRDREERFHYFLLPAFFLLLIEVLLTSTRLRSIP